MNAKKNWLLVDDDGNLYDSYNSLAQIEKDAFVDAEENPGSIFTVYEAVSYFTTGKAIKHSFSPVKK